MRSNIKWHGTSKLVGQRVASLSLNMELDFNWALSTFCVLAVVIHCKEKKYVSIHHPFYPEIHGLCKVRIIHWLFLWKYFYVMQSVCNPTTLQSTIPEPPFHRKRPAKEKASVHSISSSDCSFIETDPNKIRFLNSSLGLSKDRDMGELSVLSSLSMTVDKENSPSPHSTPVKNTVTL